MGLLEETVANIKPQDEELRKRAICRLQNLIMPHWALGRLMDLAVDLAGITRSLRPPVERRVIVVMAGDHGVVEEGVTKYPQEVTRQMIGNFLRGGAAINAIARMAQAEVLVVDMGVAGEVDPLSEETRFVSRKVSHGTSNMAKGPAMSRVQARTSVEEGIRLGLELSKYWDLLATGDMGIGNTTPSAAILAVMGGYSVKEVTGRGTGLDDKAVEHKVQVIERAISINRPDPTDPLDVMAKVGGFEIGGIAGLILGWASRMKPVIIDGFISTAGGIVAHGLCPLASHYMIASHRSAEKGHGLALEYLGLRPLLDLDLRLGEGTGAALVMPLVEASVRLLTEVATFEEASVSRSIK